jgi:hypothetical protein
MKPHPRIRKTIKWGGAAVTLLLVVVWFVSGSFSATWGSKAGYKFDLIKGGVFFAYSPATVDGASVIGWELSEVNPRFADWQWCDWVPTCGRYSPLPGWYVLVPLLFLAAPCSLVTATAWRIDTLARRRARLNLCPKCNYDRAGIAKDAVCPECGCGGTSGSGSDSLKG